MTSPATMRLMGLLWVVFLLGACGDDPAPTATVQKEVAPAPTATAPEETDVTTAVEIPSWAKVAPEQIAEAKKHGVPVAFENDLGMRFVLIPAGTFL